MKEITALLFGISGAILFFIGIWQINVFLFFGVLFYYIAWLWNES
jgi:hypothetical protein